MWHVTLPPEPGGSTMSRTVKKLLGVGAALISAGGIVYWLSLRLFFALMSVMGMGLMMLSALTMLITFRKAKAVVPRSLMISMGVSVLSAAVIASFSAFRPGWGLPAMSLLFGALLGSGWGSTTVMFTEGAAIRSRGSGWYLVVWMLSMLITQLIPLVSGRTPAAGMVLLFGGAGLVLGNSGVMLLRYRSLKAASIRPPPPQP
jgi:hypothetical protein